MNAIHHVTAIAGKARRNLEFYTNVLGLRLVKKTVNFDDPGTFHFYFGDRAGSPGTLITFFPWEHAAPGRPGAGQIEETAFAVPEQALGFWLHRLQSQGVPHSPIETFFGRKAIRFADFDGTNLMIVAHPRCECSTAWATSQISAEDAIRGIDSVTMTVEDPARSAALLTDIFGFQELESEHNLCRYMLREGGIGSTIYVRTAQEVFNGRFGRGSVHHVAFRAMDDEEQARLAKKLLENHGIQTTSQKDRNYFRSIYFREPGGVIFEIATDGPGFDADEPLDFLGTSLKLPPHIEHRREYIEGQLPDLES